MIMEFEIPSEEKDIAVALSGGGDSMALAHMICTWASLKGRTIHLLTVNHNLRPDSGREAEWVRQCVINFPNSVHHILLWDFDVKPIGLTALNSLRIEAGIPRYGAELDDSIIPLEAELEHAIDFEKGCYIGQEIVARMKHRGHPNRLLRGLEIECDTPPVHNDLIFGAEKEVGWITSAVNSPTLGKTIALGYVRMAFTDAGSKVEIDMANGRVNAIVVSLPFYRLKA